MNINILRILIKIYHAKKLKFMKNIFVYFYIVLLTITMYYFYQKLKINHLVTNVKKSIKIYSCHSLKKFFFIFLYILTYDIIFCLNN